MRCPGTLSRKLYTAALPTASWPSKAARVRSNSSRVSAESLSASENGEPWKACMATRAKPSNSSGLTGLTGYGWW